MKKTEYEKKKYVQKIKYRTFGILKKSDTLKNKKILTAFVLAN